MNWSVTETRALAERAAVGAGAPFAQAARFANGVVQHLHKRRSAEEIEEALLSSDMVSTLALEAERAIEAASLKSGVWEERSVSAPLLQSILEGPPCATDVTMNGDTIRAQISLDAPSQMAQPARVSVPYALQSPLHRLAELTYVPDTAQSRAMGAGAGLMELD